jgi:photosystem II stability/assembly factor-like uncharacterized protein
MVRNRLAAALSGTALLAAGCGSASSVHPQAAQTLPASAPSPQAQSSRAQSAGSQPAGVTCAGGASAAGSQARVPALDAVQFVSARQGWVAGAGQVLATTDGGQTWTRQYSGPAQLDQVDFVDTRNGWAVGLTSLLRTTDGGATWTAAQDPCGSIRSVHFVTPAVGYAVEGGSQLVTDGGLPAPAVGGQLLTTTDGGQHWLAAAGAPAQVQTACFTSAATGYLGTPGKIWRTSDGGGHWTLAFAEPAAAGGGGRQGTPDTTVLECAKASPAAGAAWVLFRGSGAALGHAPYLAYAIPQASPARALFEEAYIESAVRPQVHAPDGPGSYPGPFSVVSQDTAVFAGFDPAAGYGAVPLMAVTAAGLTRAGNVSGISQAYGIAFVSDTQGWAVGKNMRTGEYAVEATADAGRTWTRQYQARA